MLHPRVSKKGFLFLILFLSQLLNSCAGPDRMQAQAERKTRVWPSAPAAPRISFVKEIDFSQDIKRDLGWWDRVKEIFTGSTRTGIVRAYGLTVNDQGKLMVADPGGRLVHIYNLTDRKYFTLPHRKDSLRLLSPIDLDEDSSGRVYVSDSAAKQVYVFNPKGRFETAFGEFMRPAGLAVHNGLSRIYVVDTKGHRVRVYSTLGEYLFDFGERGQGPGEFNYPTNICLDREEKVYITDAMNFRVQVFDTEGRFLYTFGAAGDGPGSFSKPRGIGVDSEGHIYVADASFDNVQIFDHLGQTLLYFGSPGQGPGEFYLPAGIAVDRQDRIYVADSFNQRIQVFQYLKKEAAIEEISKIPSSLLLIGSAGDAFFVIEKSTQTLFRFEKQGEKVNLVHTYPFRVGKKTAEFFPPQIGLLQEGIYFSIQKTVLDEREIHLESFPTRSDEPASQIRISSREQPGLDVYGFPEKDPPFPLVIQEGFSGIKAGIRIYTTPVIVRDEMVLVDENRVREEQSEILGFVNSWKECWERLDINCYMDHYSRAFHSNRMDWQDWKEYKRSVFAQRMESQVTLKPVHMFKDGQTVLLTFLQSYRSPDYRDLGTKRIVIERQDSDWKIIQEEWRPYER